MPADVFAALASPARRELLERLRAGGPAPVASLASAFEMRRPSVSEHLRVLREAGLVTEQRQGRQRIYRLHPEPLLEVTAWLAPYEVFWRQRLSGLRDLLDSSAEGGGVSGKGDRDG